MRDRLEWLYQRDPMAVYTFTAIFSRFARDKFGSNTACFSRVRLDGQVVADHAWVHRSKHMKRLELVSGDVVTFEAQIGRYARTGGQYGIIEMDYELEKIRNIAVIERRKG